MSSGLHRLPLTDLLAGRASARALRTQASAAGATSAPFLLRPLQPSALCRTCLIVASLPTDPPHTLPLKPPMQVLIFSQFKIMLDVIEDALRLAQLPLERIDGSTAQRARQGAIDRFSQGGAHAQAGRLQPSACAERLQESAQTPAPGRPGCAGQRTRQGAIDRSSQGGLRALL